MPEKNAEKIIWESSSKIEQTPEQKKETTELPKIIKTEQTGGNLPKNPESTAPFSPNETEKIKEKKIELEDLTNQLALMLKEADPSAESGEKKIQSLVKKIVESLVVDNDNSADITAREKDRIIEQLSEGNLGTYGYLQEVFNEEIGSKLSRKSF